MGVSLTFVLGGVRSGKSDFALARATRWERDLHQTVTFVATGEARDTEMAQRIHSHQAQRPPGWVTVEEPLNVDEWLVGHSNRPIVIIDCLSLLVSNWLGQDVGEAALRDRSQSWLQAVSQFPGHLLVVSNEVGQGLIPTTPLGRVYRDGLGWLNQKTAALAKDVVWVVAGLGINLRDFQVQP
jgi:adenosyl cobinamide kinase/adenosyl cobinamide phosphate guanylyltransferase